MPPAVAAAGIAVGGSLLSASAAKKSAKTAANAQTQANQAAIAEQQRQYDLTRGDLMPFQQAGVSALGQQGNLLGLNGTDAQTASIQALQASPLYQSLFRTGQEAVLQNASATGGLRGGNTNASLANFGRDTLAQVIQQQLGQLGGVAQAGQNAAAQTGTFGANSANNIAELLSGSGTAQANAALAAGNANVGAINGIAGALGGMAGNSGVQQWVGKLF